MSAYASAMHPPTGHANLSHSTAEAEGAQLTELAGKRSIYSVYLAGHLI